jgi:hypothetical protein
MVESIQIFSTIKRVQVISDHLFQVTVTFKTHHWAQSWAVLSTSDPQILRYNPSYFHPRSSKWILHMTFPHCRQFLS